MAALSREEVQVLRAGLAAGEFPLTEEAVGELIDALDAAVQRWHAAKEELYFVYLAGWSATSEIASLEDDAERLAEGLRDCRDSGYISLKGEEALAQHERKRA